MRKVYLHLADKHEVKLPVVATVIRTKGSAPQVPGSSALFTDEGLISGTIGGGAVEGRIQEVAGEKFQTRQSGYFHFNLLNDISRKEEAICGGQITILVDADPGKHSGVFNRMKTSLLNNEHGVLMTIVTLSDEDEVTIERQWITKSEKPYLPGTIISKAEPVIAGMLNDADPDGWCEIDLSEQMEDNRFMFLESVFPPLKLVIAGAGHIGRSLAHFGKVIGFEVTVVDDRTEYANRENIPDAEHIIAEDIGRTIRELPKRADTYLVIVTRGHKDDAEALRSCIGSELAYVGMIGSRSKTTAMRGEFLKQGWATESQWDAVYTPIGLDINSQTVEEIAISIIAQIIKVKNDRKEKRKGCPA